LIRAEFERQVATFQSYKVNEEAGVVDGKIQSIVNDLKSFYVLKDDMAKKDFALTTTHIYQLFLVTKAVEDVHVINPEGFEILGVARTGLAAQSELRDLREAPYFKIAKAGKIYVGDIKLSGQDAYAEVAVPYFENFKLIGVVLATINFKDYFGEIVSEGALGYHHLHILDKNGIVLASPNLRIIGKDISALPLFQKLKTQADGVMTMVCDECTEVGEFQVITAAERIKHPLGLYVVLESDPAQALAFYYRARNIFAGASVALVVFYIGLVWIFSARLRRRFQVLTEGIDRFHQGNYTQKIVLRTGDELEYVAEHVNHFVTEIERGDAEQKEMLQLLAQTDTVKYNFIKTISHQLRTPITSMLWLLENLTDQLAGALTKEQNSLFQNIYKAIQNINGIINDMILVVDMEDKKVALEVSSVNFAELLTSALKDVQTLADERGVKLLSKQPADGVIQGTADGKKLRAVLKRLLENAILYSEPHTNKEVVAGVDAHEDQVIYYVSDQGIGIPLSEQGMIYGKFYRATNAYKLFQNASGLGLFIARHFVELHGGKLWFDSQEGVGSNFYFSVPLTQKGKK
jgi:signal transduction histidine kinase